MRAVDRDLVRGGHYGQIMWPLPFAIACRARWTRPRSSPLDAPGKVLSRNQADCEAQNRAGSEAGLSRPIFIFLAFREKIERAASAKFERTVRVPYEILAIQELDLPADVGRSVLSHSA
jgi:hypothetical protein